MYLLDTNVCIALLNGVGGPVHARVVDARTMGAAMHVSSVSIFELEFGIAKSAPARRTENQTRLNDFLDDPNFMFIDWSVRDASAAGRVRDHLRRTGKTIGPYDMLLAGQALARKLIFVTANVGEFTRVPDLTVENWSNSV